MDGQLSVVRIKESTASASSRGLSVGIVSRKVNELVRKALGERPGHLHRKYVDSIVHDLLYLTPNSKGRSAKR
jgi:hypothetical protein